MRLKEYLNPNKYYSVLFQKDGSVDIDDHDESRFDAIAYASDLPSIGAIVVMKNRRTGSIKVSRADFNVDTEKKQQLQMKRAALDLVSNQ